jgi:hypothetical protein
MPEVALALSILSAVAALIASWAAVGQTRALRSAARAETDARLGETERRDQELELMRSHIDHLRSVWLEGRRPMVTIASSTVDAVPTGWKVNLRLVNLGSPAAWVEVDLVDETLDHAPVSSPQELPSVLPNGGEASVSLVVPRGRRHDHPVLGEVAEGVCPPTYVVPRIRCYGVDGADPSSEAHPDRKVSRHRVFLEA